jgi:hypothetical protein
MTTLTREAAARQWFLDESLRIAVWELLFGTGSRRRVEELLREGARWQRDEPAVMEGQCRAAAR